MDPGLQVGGPCWLPFNCCGLSSAKFTVTGKPDIYEPPPLFFKPNIDVEKAGYSGVVIQRGGGCPNQSTVLPPLVGLWPCPGSAQLSLSSLSPSTQEAEGGTGFQN